MTRKGAALIAGLVIVALAIGGGAWLYFSQPALASGTATLTIFTGSAEVRAAGSGSFAAGHSGETLAPGAEVRTGASSKANITYPDGSQTRLDSGTDLTLTSLAKASGGGWQTQLHQSTGKTWSKVVRLTAGASYTVKGPNNSTAEARGTDFTFSIRGNTVQVDVWSGSVAVTSGGKSVTVSTGQSTILTAGAPPTPPAPIAAADRTDSFTVFNQTADQTKGTLSGFTTGTLSPGVTAGPLPGGLGDGQSDLQVTLGWPGSRFQLTVLDPQGGVYDISASGTPPVTIVVPQARAGAWSFKVLDLESNPDEVWWVVLSKVTPSRASASVLFLEKQCAPITIEAGSTGTFKVHASHPRATPSLSATGLTSIGAFTDNNDGSATVSLSPPADAEASTIRVVVTATASGSTASITCTATITGAPPAPSPSPSPSASTTPSPASSPSASSSPSPSPAPSPTPSATPSPSPGPSPSPSPNPSPSPSPSASPSPSPSPSPTGGLKISPTSLNGTEVGAIFVQRLTATGGTGSYQWSVMTPPLAPGLTLDATGLLGGTPTTPGVYPFAIKVTDSSSASASQSYSLNVAAAPVLFAVNPFPGSQYIGTNATQRLAEAEIGRPYEAKLGLTGALPAASWSILAGSLPPGLVLNSGTGVVSGTPTAGGSRSAFTVGVIDTGGGLATRSFLIGVYPVLTLAPTAYPAVVNMSYFFSPWQNGRNIVALSVSAGTLPAGLSIVNLSSGCPACPPYYGIGGTPTATGTSSFTLHAADSLGGTADRSYTITVYALGPAIDAAATPPAATDGVPFSWQVPLIPGREPPYYWSLNDFISGLTINFQTGLISGTVSSPAGRALPITVSAWDTNGNFSQATFVIPVYPVAGPRLVVDLPVGSVDVGLVESSNLIAAGGTAPYHWSVSVGSLPPGTSLADCSACAPASGQISGTATSAGTYQFTLQVRDSSVIPKTASFPIVQRVNPPITVNVPSTLPGGTTGVMYSQPLVALGGSGFLNWQGYAPSTYIWTLPPGLYPFQAGDGSWTLQGVPSLPGTFSSKLYIQDLGTGPSLEYLTVPFTITIAAGPLKFDPRVPPNGVAGVPYPPFFGHGGFSGFPLLTLGGDAKAATWAVASGTLPPGVTLKPPFCPGCPAFLTGTSTTAGSYTFTISATDTTGTATATYTIVIEPAFATLGITAPGADVGQTYSRQLTAVGSGPFSWLGVRSSDDRLIDSGTILPFDVSSTGAVTGSPTVSGSFTFFVEALDSLGVWSVGYVAFVVAAGPPSIATASVANGAVGATYALALAAQGGTPAYSWAVTGGTLPAGVVLDAFGHLVGTPTVAGSSTFTVTVTDAAGGSSSRLYTLTVV